MVLPEGLPLNTSTVITGSGGSGKPLIGETFVSAWLKENKATADHSRKVVIPAISKL